jgi:hypothetical protein
MTRSIAAIVLLGLIDLVAIRYYLTFMAKSRSNRPPVFYSNGFHLGVWGVVLALMITAAMVLYPIRWWLSVTPLVFLIVRWGSWMGARSHRLGEILRQAAELEMHLRKQGVAEKEICKELNRRFLGEKYAHYWSDDKESISVDDALVYYILPELGLHDSEGDIHERLEHLGDRSFISENDKVRAMIQAHRDYARSRASAASMNG